MALDFNAMVSGKAPFEADEFHRCLFESLMRALSDFAGDNGPDLLDFADCPSWFSSPPDARFDGSLDFAGCGNDPDLLDLASEPPDCLSRSSSPPDSRIDVSLPDPDPDSDFAAAPRGAGDAGDFAAGFPSGISPPSNPAARELCCVVAVGVNQGPLPGRV